MFPKPIEKSHRALADWISSPLAHRDAFVAGASPSGGAVLDPPGL